MEVILKEAVKNLGNAGDIVKVSEGYARNFLFPSSKAVPATGDSIKAVQDQVRKKQNKVKKETDIAAENAKKMEGVELTITKRASGDGKLFGSVTEADIAGELQKLGHPVDKSNIRVGKHIKEPGSYEVLVHFKSEAEAKIKLLVVGENDKKAG
jgi:large subunit ribosomal protein L9